MLPRMTIRNQTATSPVGVMKAVTASHQAGDDVIPFPATAFVAVQRRRASADDTLPPVPFENSLALRSLVVAVEVEMTVE